MSSDVPDGWTNAPLHALGSSYPGLSGKTKADFGAGKPFVTYRQVFGGGAIDLGACELVSVEAGERQHRVRSGDVLFTISSETAEEVAYSAVVLAQPDELYLNSFCFGFRPTSPDVLWPTFSKYLFRGPSFRSQAVRLGQGSTRINISKTRLMDVALHVPPLPQQKKIAAILSVVDAAIERTQAVIEQTQRVKSALLKEFFEAGAGSWKVVRLDRLAEVRSGIAKNSNRKLTDPIEVAYLRVANVQDGYLDLTEIKTIEIERQAVERYRIEIGDVLMNEGGDIDKLGRGDIWRGQIPVCVNQNHVFAVRCGGRLMPEYLSYLAESPYGKAYFLRAGKQSTNLASINKTQLRALPVPLPPMARQSEVVSYIDSIRSSLDANERRANDLEALKAGLLQDLLTGKVRVTV